MDKNRLIALSFIVLIVVLLVFVLLSRPINSVKEGIIPSIKMITNQASSSDLTYATDWLAYTNDHYDFTVTYPKGISYQEFNEGGDSLTITFQDLVLGRGFQIFITPYEDDYVTEERLRRDIPSGQIVEPTEILVADARGVMFFSQNPVMGETREVWFIKNGYLYEATTYRELDNWLSQIMATWQWL